MLFVIVKIGSHNNPLKSDNIIEKDTHHQDPKSQDVFTIEAKNDLKIFESFNEIVLWSSDFQVILCFVGQNILRFRIQTMSIFFCDVIRIQRIIMTADFHDYK